MSLKVYIHLQESGLGFADKTSKIQVPKSWSSKTVKDLIQLFLKSYESSFPGKPLTNIPTYCIYNVNNHGESLHRK